MWKVCQKYEKLGVTIIRKTNSRTLGNVLEVINGDVKLAVWLNFKDNEFNLVQRLRQCEPRQRFSK